MNYSDKPKTNSIIKRIKEDLKRTSLERNPKDRRRFQKLRKAIKDIRRKNSNI